MAELSNPQDVEMARMGSPFYPVNNDEVDDDALPIADCRRQMEKVISNVHGDEGRSVLPMQSLDSVLSFKLQRK